MRLRFPERSIRWRIMACVVVALAVMGLCLLVTIYLNHRLMERIGGSYRTNAQLTEVSNCLGDMERALENYIAYHTFESIDAYYHYQSVSEDLLSWFPERPSTDELLQKEYIVRQLIVSFFVFSREAVTAQRANDGQRAEENYKKSLACYAMLQTQIEELNILFMRRNADVYTANQEAYGLLAQFSVVFLLLFFLLVLAMLYLSVTVITKPLYDISAVALRLAKRDFDVPLFNSTSATEIGNICRAFDRMTISIREYVDMIWEKSAQEYELKEKELEMRELYANAQLRALQNQINPHFLFNTLNTGAQLAMIEGADKTCYFIEQVADFFRYNIQQKQPTATIDEELALIDNFVYIMKVRFGERLEFIKKVSSGRHSQLLPRMTLQPLVENCIKHGLKGAKGRVVLSIEPEIYVTKISVSDNGSGFSEELRQNILQQKPDTEAIPKASDGTGTGLVNVISRLRLYFHRQDVFDILSNDDGGTTFLLRIPNV